MSFVQSHILGELTCQKCKKYLSHFPIYSHPDKGSYCGRCEHPSGENVTRNKIYEHLAQSQKFPCCYTSHGCTENLAPNKIPHHEKFCTFRRYDCPLACYANCDWQGFEKDLLDHYEQKHPIFLLREGHFELDFVNSHNENFLLPYGESLYLVNETNDSKSNLLSITVDYIGSNSEAEGHLYNIVLENEIKSHSHVLTNKIKTRTDISGDVIRSVLNDPLSVVARIEIIQDDQKNGGEEDESKEYNKTVNCDILRELECLVCMEYMIPPIHQCITGHSICFDCKKNLNAKGKNECPTCKQEFKNTQNFALAQIINHLTYPCKFSKCKFTSNTKQIKQHEATCIYGPFQCPLKEYEYCDIEVPFKEIGDHIENNHYENLLEMVTVSLPFEDFAEEDEDCYILKYNFNLFKMHYMYRDGAFHWAMQLIGPGEESVKYKFEIDIIDTSGNNHRAYFKSSCSSLSDKAVAFSDDRSFIYIDYNQIKSLITNEFSYRVRVLKE